MLPGRAVQALGDAHRHALVIGRMKLDDVEPPALAVEGFQSWRVLVREPPALEGGRAAARFTECGQPLDRYAAAFAVDGFPERPVAGEEVYVLEWRALIEHLVCGKRAVHAAPHKLSMAGRFGLQSHALAT